MHRLISFPVSALLLLVGVTPAFAQLIPGWTTKQFKLERIDADQLVFVGEVEMVGEGNNKGQQIFADNVQWNIRTGEFVASGNVVLVSPTSRLSAERVEFNTKTRLGTFHEASGIASLGAAGQKDRSMFGTLEPDVLFYGETIDKIGEDRYRIKNGGFTTCVQPTPRWEIVSGTSTIDLGDYAILRNAVIRVKNVPMFYLPVLYYPIQDDDRATGFLIPTYGTSTYRGQSLSNAFFWAINRSQDATFFHDWFTSRGQGGGTEYRYTSAPGADGFFRAYWLNEKQTIGSGTSATTQPARRSYELRGRLVQPLPARLTARATVDYFSDVVTQQLYNQNIYDATRSQRQYGGTVTGNWGHVNLTSSYNRSELFLSDTRSLTTGTAPNAIVSFASTRLGQLPVYFAMNTDASRTLYADRDVAANGTEVIDDRGLGRVDVYPTLRSPLTKWPFLNINSYFGFRSTYYSESLNEKQMQVPVGLWRRYAEMRAEVTGPIFTRVFSPQNGFAERMKHLIEPAFTIQRTTNVDNQSRIPAVGSSYDVVIGGVTRVTYGLNNRLLVRKPETKRPDQPASPSSTAPREFLSASLSQSYYSDPRASQFDQTLLNYGNRRPSNFSPIILNVRSTPTTLSGANLVAEYDASKGELEALSAAGTLNYQKAQARVGWSNRLFGTQGRTNTLDASTTLNFAQGRTGGTYTMNWDITRGLILQQRWIGFYNAQCCGLAVEYQEFSFGTGSVIPKDRRFNLSFTLAGIGSFSNFFGAFGGGRF